MNKTQKNLNLQYREGEGSFSPSLKTIESKLGETIVSVEDLSKLYGSKSNNSIVTTLDKRGGLKRYVLKCASSQDISNEINGTKAIEKYLPVSKVIAYSLINNKAWLLREYISGVLMADMTNHFEPQKNIEHLIELETEKEKLIVKGYSKLNRSLSKDDYMNLTANKLFHHRLIGDRYKNFYVDGEHIPKLINKKVVINGRSYSLTVEEIFKSILEKYSTKRQIRAFVGHGDAHQGNVIVSDKGSVRFFDNEYAGVMPVGMDLSKPYYNDFLGTLFFHFHERLLGYFKVKSIFTDRTTIQLKIGLKQKLDTRMKITLVKLEQRKKYLGNGDLLGLNDYLFMCHTLNRDPNLFPETVRGLFLAFCVILNDFDPFNPESLYAYF